MLSHKLLMANKQELQKQLKDLDNQISQATDDNERARLQEQRNNVQRQLDQ
jgi:hypothetical protein